MARTNTFDTGSEGAAVTATTTANDGSASATPIGAGTMVYRGASAVRGAKGVRANAADGATFQLPFSETAAASMSFMVAFVVDSANYPTAGQAIIRARNSSANTCKITYSATGVMAVQDGGSSVLKNFNGNTALPNGKYWVCGQVTTGTTTTNGKIEVQVYRDSDLALVDSVSRTDVNTGTTNQQTFQIGKTESAGVATLDFDELYMRNAATPVAYTPSATPPTVILTGADYRVIDATGSMAATSYSIAQTNGTAFTPIPAGTGRWEVARDTAGDRTYTVTGTGSGSSTASYTVPQVQTVAAAPVQRLRRVNGTWQ